MQKAIISATLSSLLLASPSLLAQQDPFSYYDSGLLDDTSQDGGSGEDAKPFELLGEVGLIVTTGNTETSSFSGKLTAHHELAKWANDYGAEVLYRTESTEDDEGNDESQTTAQRVYVSGQANYKLTDPNKRLFAFGSYEDDRFNGFEYQATVAVGWNQKLWDNKKSAFAYSVGPGYAQNERDDGTDASGVIIRGALDYRYKISDSASFRQLLSTEAGSENTKSKSESTLTTKINGKLSMNFSIVLNHNTDVESGRDNLDTRSSVTLVYTFF